MHRELDLNLEPKWDEYSGYVLYCKRSKSPYKPLLVGINQICKRDMETLLPSPLLGALELIPEDHVVDVQVRAELDELVVKNRCSVPLETQVCTFTQPHTLQQGQSHRFLQVTQLSLVFGLSGSSLELNIKLQRTPYDPELKSGRRRWKRLRKSLETVEKSVLAWKNLEDSKSLCCICLNQLKEDVGGLECGHFFCWGCIECWAEQMTMCPLCKAPFQRLARIRDEEVLEVRNVEEKKFNEEEFEMEAEICYECNDSGHEDQLLVCDECDVKYCHTYCDGLDCVPKNDWLCKYCRKQYEDLLCLY